MGQPTIAQRVAARYKQADESAWLPDMLGTKARVVDEVLRAIKQMVRDADGSFAPNPKAVAGGMFYFLVKDRAGQAVAQKLWTLLDASAGLDAGDKVWRLAQRVLHHLHGDRAKGSVEAAAIGVALLQRTRQQTKAQRANAIMLAELKDQVAEYGPPEDVKAKTKAQLFAEMVGEQKALASQIVGKEGMNPAEAAILVWRVLEDVNAHEASSVAETTLSPLVDMSNEALGQVARKYVSQVSVALDYGVVEAGAFGVALMEAVGQRSYASKLSRSMLGAFGEYIGESDIG